MPLDAHARLASPTTNESASQTTKMIETWSPGRFCCAAASQAGTRQQRQQSDSTPDFLVLHAGQDLGCGDSIVDTLCDDPRVGVVSHCAPLGLVGLTDRLPHRSPLGSAQSANILLEGREGLAADSTLQASSNAKPRTRRAIAGGLR